MTAPLEWRCFHCGDVFTDPHAAAQHFGIDEGKTPACKIKGSEHGLIKALRDAEAEADEAVQRMHSESTDAAKAYHRQRTRHAQALIAAEEVGYARGMRDARAEVAHALCEALEWFSGERRLSLQHHAPMYGDDDDQSVEWRVLRESGPINDREWDIIGRGDTAPAAILAAFNQRELGHVQA